MSSTEPDQDVTPALGAALAAIAECVFCDRIAAGEFDYFDRYSVAFQPLNPVTPGHFLVVPRTHAESALEAPNNAGRALAFAAKLAVEMGLDACNLITSAGAAATQTIQHVHVHVVPRREGDGLALPWTGQRKTNRTSSTAALLGQRVRVKLAEHVVQEGRLLGFDDGGEIQIEGDDGFVWHGWPALEVTPVTGAPS